MKPLQLLQRCHAQLKMPSKKPFFKSARKYFREYCDLSTIHGLKYVGGNRTTAERGWWLIVLLLSLTCCSYLIYLIYDKWQSNPIIIGLANEDQHTCRWRNQYFDCRELFDIILTDDGACFSFNLLSPKRIYKDNNYFFDRINSEGSSNWSLNRGYSQDIGRGTYPRNVSFSGATNGLDVDLYVNNDFNDPFCRPFWTLQGFKVILHTPSSVPRLSQEHLYLPISKLLIGAIKPIVINTSEKVKNFSPEKRNCYFENESPLKYFRNYTQNNCELDCLARYTLYWCDCVAFYMPMDNITAICGSVDQGCMQEAEEKMLKNELIIKQNHTDNEKPPQCPCLPCCSDLNYEVETSSIKYDTEEPGNRSHSKLVIYFKGNHFMASNRPELYGITDFIGNFGGLLGLFTGFSILSFMEIIYFLTVRILYNIRLYGQWSGKIDEESNS
ncbi:hypothetical protein ABEB36_007881 [Hypothenemus hampei]|uniref:Uncharacterized protein n=1 Tax=Hypothenemus hampei TaxID=57062 RepID=A0ABD1EYJ0_HYPHA